MELEFDIAENILNKCVIFHGQIQSGKTRAIENFVRDSRFKFNEIHGFSISNHAHDAMNRIGSIILHNAPDKEEIYKVCDKNNLIIFDDFDIEYYAKNNYYDSYRLLKKSKTTQIHKFHSIYDCPTYLREMADILVFTQPWVAAKFFKNCNTYHKYKKKILIFDYERNVLVYMCDEDKFYHYSRDKLSPEFY
jgi:hypothetical protein